MVYKNSHDFISIPVPLMKIDAGAKQGHMHERLKLEAYRINIFDVLMKSCYSMTALRIYFSVEHANICNLN